MQQGRRDQNAWVSALDGVNRARVVPNPDQMRHIMSAVIGLIKSKGQKLRRQIRIGRKRGRDGRGGHRLTRSARRSGRFVIGLLFVPQLRVAPLQRQQFRVAALFNDLPRL